MTASKLFFTVLSISIFSSSAMAASDTPLADLFGGFVKSLSNQSGTGQSASPAATGTTNTQIEHILAMYSNSTFGSSHACAKSIKKAVHDTNSALELGDLSKALGQSKISLGMIGGCYAEGKEYPRLVGETINYPLSTWANLIGGQLAIGLSLEAKMGDRLQDSVHKKNIENTKVLLSFANAQNENGAAEMLAELNKAVGSAQDPTASTQSALIGTVESIVSQYSKNSFGFDQKYVGKTITVTGQIDHILGSTDHVSIDMIGTPGKDKNQIGEEDKVSFNITDPAQMSKVSSLEVGKRVKIRGVYQKQPYSSQVSLVSCEILK